MIRPRPPRHVICIALMLMSLLFAQALGYLHGIAHVGWPAGTVRSTIDESWFDAGEVAQSDASTVAVASTSDDDRGQSHEAHGAHHSCEAYDAATLSAAMHLDFPVPPLLPPTRMLALWQAFASWDAPVIRYFSPRAPPR